MKRLFSFLWVACFLGSCQPQPARARLPVVLPPPWQYDDLRSLDPVDAPVTQDLVAAYLRQVDDDLQFRLDYLDLPIQPDSDLYIQLSRAGATVQIIVPAAGAVQALAADGSALPDARLRVFRDAALDTVMILLHAPALPGELHIGFELSAWITSPANTQRVDEIPAVRSDALSPEPVRALLVFTNALPAATPAQALRSWDGAHSGPRGVRHGLRGLLDAIEITHTPVWLLDVKTLPTLSALDTLGGVERLRRLQQRGLLILSDTFTLASERETMIGYGLLTVDLSSDFWLCYSGYTHSTDSTDAAHNGPGLELRRIFSQPGKKEVIVIGGDLAYSTWGEPKSAADTLRYLANRPWIHFLNAAESARLEPECAPTGPHPRPTPSAEVQQALNALALAPTNPLAEAARQALASLLSPATMERQSLQNAAAGQVGILLAAARWAERPAVSTDCSRDLDWDGAAECILASTDTFAVIELDGGYIPLLAILADDGPHQIIAPSTQFAIGLSDPTEWEVARGLRGDPRAILGAFDGGQPFRVVEMAPGKMTLAAVDGEKKIYTLLSRGLRADFGGRQTLKVSIPLGLDGWQRANPGWAAAFQESAASNGWRWGLDSLFEVEIRTNGILSHDAFTDSLPWLAQPEDPNLGYPAGHFLPFPLALATILGEDGLWVEIETLP